MRRYAVTGGGALHAGKFYRTVSGEFNSSRVAFRWRHLTALARITASGFGRPVARHGGSAGSAESVTACHGWASDFSLERELGRRSAAMMV
jgi:hypothetical protein